MMISHWIVLISWLAFIGYWAVSAIGVKKDTTSEIGWWSRRAITIRLALAAVIILLVIFRSQNVGRIFENRGYVFGTAVSDAGAVLCVLGTVFAIWARWHLGKNWSSRPTLKEGHELVTSGPYGFVRHPIYTGILTSALGSALVAGSFWLMILVVLCFVFVRRVSKEEQLMMRQFPNEYPEYKKQTKALIPFIW
ncbi:MAG: isoprenylcysteine carboxylmethyltransferase family protein [Candidatus Moranbacteria bacterium]|nr:isoprenylcysteine carboxylmethyltransferase family protein [Candidatus Moranbacteria bacterium]